MPEPTFASVSTISSENLCTMTHAWESEGTWDDGHTVFTSGSAAPCVWGLVVSCQVDGQPCTWLVEDGTITLTVL